MENVKKHSLLLFFKRLRSKSSTSWFSRSTSGLRWKRRAFRFPNWVVDGFLFKIVSVLEGVVLVSTLCIFFLCCGCHF